MPSVTYICGGDMFTTER